MNIVVCIRQGRNGEINPFDACAYEEALKIPGANITLLSMGVPSTKDFLLNLTRLGAEKAVLLTDKAFAGADTIATAYTLSLAINMLKPDIVFCGRQTLEGDTAQTPPMLAEMVKYNYIAGTMAVENVNEQSITCKTRRSGTQTAEYPAVVTVERINTLRLPSIRSKIGTVEVLGAADIGADVNKCGLKGSPTRVIDTKENCAGRRKCTFLPAAEFLNTVKSNMDNTANNADTVKSRFRLNKVYTLGTAPLEFARQISDDVTVIAEQNADAVIDCINKNQPNAVLFGSDASGKEIAATVAAKLNLGLCADCTSLETDGNKMFMIRPALSGTVIAKIKSETTPALATVRTVQPDTPDIVVCVGMGAADCVEEIRKFADGISAGIASTRRVVDNSVLPYETQVGLTGKTVAPPLYIAFGVSGAVHHIVGMKQSGTVIAVNPDKSAPVFDYADYGFNCTAKEILDLIK